MASLYREGRGRTSSGDILQRSSVFQEKINRGDTKKSQVFFQEKIGVTPSVTAPGDTNPSDATAACTGIETAQSSDICASEMRRNDSHCELYFIRYSLTCLVKDFYGRRLGGSVGSTSTVDGIPHSIRSSGKHHAAVHAIFVVVERYCRWQLYIVGIGIFDLFGSCCGSVTFISTR